MNQRMPVALVDRLAAPPGAVLVRTRADGPDWLDRLPVVPGGRHVTVSVSHPDLRAVPAHLLLERGYRIVGVHPWRASTDGHGSVDLLVHADLIEAAPDWWRALVTVADRAFDLRLGPVQRVLGDEIALHLTY